MNRDKFIFIVEIETKYFDSLTPYSEQDNFHYIEKLQEDIRNLRSDYTNRGKKSPNLEGRKQFDHLMAQSPKLKVR